MTTPCERYGSTESGQRLAAIINDPARYLEYRAFSREGYPAVMAVVSLVRPELEQLRGCDPTAFNAAKQYVGWAVGQLMRGHGHRVVQRRRVRGGLLTLGAVWSDEPAVGPTARGAA
jgi:hypothetical protein